MCFFGSIWCLFSPKNPKNIIIFGKIFGILTHVLGLTIKLKQHYFFKKNAIYISNHQNNYDLIIAAKIVQKRTLTIGKKSLKWIPLFGQLYWLTGNIFIDRKNFIKSYHVISNQVITALKKKHVSFWIFPEGKRSYSSKLLPFKTGAFYAAIKANVPIIPIVISNTNKIRLNKLNNGTIIVKVLKPIYYKQMNIQSERQLAYFCHKLMASALEKINKEAIEIKKL
ncbi:1-acyl-sn-glycerol-3-phosphate acyltransferase PlsC [Candidatus Tachikawaea gelatinosa]|uniref:1-acyl-sn-glycerol-3-phosphate acyltransferase n=1 Tax=Candidatus Tachikawaea gelatinosa TaxID=1410383 RepID=A0A090ALN3_9ENTR|nr:1-acyl-sn-glycerol-3-phosphate acyltransferase PlsC [Candidatus Tachikawaea gelatinosa]